MAKIIKRLQFHALSNIALVVALFGALLFAQASDPPICTAQGNCPEPAAYGMQPYPVDLVKSFDRASTNRLGNQGPGLPQIWKGYPSSQLVSPYVPCILLKAMGYTESSGWKQFDAGYGQYGYTVIATDCGYGIMQITSGMDGGAGFDPSRVAGESAYNIGTGARLLIEKWNSLSQYIGNNDPRVVEDWYYAVWAYNSWGWTNNPNRNCPESNPDCGYAFNPFRPPFTGTQPRRWYPYQEIVWGYAANPPGANFWQALPLTLPSRGSITNPPLQHIDTPQPSHSSCSVAYFPVTLKTYPACSQPILNSGFEAGGIYWILNGTIISTIIPHSGVYSAWLGGNNYANDTLYQTVTVPTTGPTGRPIVSAHLKYYWYMNTEETSHPYDYLYVKIRNAYGNDLAILETLSDGSTAGMWVSSTFDVSAYIGQTIQVYFRGTTDSSNITNFYVDDVSLYACER